MLKIYSFVVCIQDFRYNKKSMFIQSGHMPYGVKKWREACSK